MTVPISEFLWTIPLDLDEDYIPSEYIKVEQLNFNKLELGQTCLGDFKGVELSEHLMIYRMSDDKVFRKRYLSYYSDNFKDKNLVECWARTE